MKAYEAYCVSWLARQSKHLTDLQVIRVWSYAEHLHTDMDAQREIITVDQVLQDILTPFVETDALGRVSHDVWYMLSFRYNEACDPRPVPSDKKTQRIKIMCHVKGNEQEGTQDETRAIYITLVEAMQDLGFTADGVPLAWITGPLQDNGSGEAQAVEGLRLPAHLEAQIQQVLSLVAA